MMAPVRAATPLSRPWKIALILATVILGHEFTYLIAYGLNGYDAAMREVGHERYWLSLVFIVASLTLGLVAITTRQLLRLRRLAASIRPSPNELPLFRGMIEHLWRRTAIGAMVFFYIQENVESVTSGNEAPGLAVFLGEHLAAIPILATVGLVVAIIGAVVAWRREVLLLRLRSVATATGRAPRRERDSGTSEPHSVDVFRGNGVRAPPAPSAA